jgi:Lar family restriction alleviation protein
MTHTGREQDEKGMEALLPCPFCGKEPHKRSRQDEDLFTHNSVEWISVACTECGYGFDWPVTCEKGAVEQWNTRAPSPTGTNAVGEAIAALDELIGPLKVNAEITKGHESDTWRANYSNACRVRAILSRIKTGGGAASTDARLREALEKIERWFGEFPDTGQQWPDGTPVSYGAAFGSNGERDYMRGIARAALSPSRDGDRAETAAKDMRECVVATAQGWFNSAREAQQAGKMKDALLFMENAFNHTENALAAVLQAAPLNDRPPMSGQKRMTLDEMREQLAAIASTPSSAERDL